MKRGMKNQFEKLSVVVTITHGVPDQSDSIIMEIWIQFDHNSHMIIQHLCLDDPIGFLREPAKNISPVLTPVALKQGLQAGIGEPRSRWESPKVQRTVSGGREGRMRMQMREESKMREELSMVAFSSDLLNLSSKLFSALPAHGVKRDRANAIKLSSKLLPSLLWRKHVIPLQTKR